MKQLIYSITMLLTLASTLQVTAQKHRHSTTTTVVNPAATATVTTTTTANATPATAPVVADTAGVEAFSDTTTVADDSLTYSQRRNYHVNVTTPLDDVFGRIDGGDIVGMVFIVCIVAIMFLLAPVLITAAIFYFINKGRKDKLKLAQMALQNGQPIPEQLMPDAPVKKPSLMYEYNLRSGIKQAFLGVGLMILLGIIMRWFGVGIGALVFFIGLGKVVIALLDKHSAQNKG